jgi:hypothetical protein
VAVRNTWQYSKLRKLFVFPKKRKKNNKKRITDYFVQPLQTIATAHPFRNAYALIQYRHYLRGRLFAGNLVDDEGDSAPTFFYYYKENNKRNNKST